MDILLDTAEGKYLYPRHYLGTYILKFNIQMHE